MSNLENLDEIFAQIQIVLGNIKGYYTFVT